MRGRWFPHQHSPLQQTKGKLTVREVPRIFHAVPCLVLVLRHRVVVGQDGTAAVEASGGGWLRGLRGGGMGVGRG